MKTKFYTLTMIAFLAITSISCSKNDVEIIPVKPTATSTNLFRYSENAPFNISSDIKTLPTANFSSQFKTLIATNIAGATIFEVNLTAATVGAYTVNSSNVITYTATNPFFVPTSGTINITANANNKISGNFEGFGSGQAGTVTRIYGEFTNVTIN